MVSTQGHLKITLEIRYHFVIGLCGRGEIIGIVHTLLMEIDMHMRHPLVEHLETLLAFHLR